MKKLLFTFVFITNHLFGQDPKIIGTLNPNYSQIDLSKVYFNPESNYWKAVINGQIPAEALVAGHEANGTKLYIARVNYKSGQLIGKVRHGDRVAMFAVGNKEVSFENYSVFVGKGKWITSIDRNSYNTVIPLGKDTTGRPIFAARSWLGGGLQNGAVDWDRKIGIPYGGGSTRPVDFEILVREETLSENKCISGIALNLKTGNHFSSNPATFSYVGVDQTVPYWHMQANKAWASTISSTKNYLTTRLYNKIIGRSNTNAVCVSITNQDKLIIQNYSEDERNNFINPNCQWKIESDGYAFRLKNIYLDKYLYINDNKINLKHSDINDKCDLGFWWIMEEPHVAAVDRN